MFRIAAFLAVLGGTLAVGPVGAQSIFNNAPPRPPADVPDSGLPPQPPPVQMPGQQPYLSAPAQPYPSGIQTQPLPPPPGTAAMPAAPARGGEPPSAPQRARIMPQPAHSEPSQPAQPADTAPHETTVITEMPPEKIANGRAVFSGLDKITGRIISFDAAIGETVQFGALQVTTRVCYTRPPTEPTNTDAFVEVDEVTLQGEIKRIFTGWMFASSPGLHAVEHPIYDVWLTGCASPLPTRVAEPAAQPAPTAAAAAAPARPPAARPRQITPRGTQPAPRAAAPPAPAQ